MGRLLLQSGDGLENHAGCRLRCLRAQVDTGEREPAKLPLQEVPLNPVGQRWRGRQDSGGADQDGSEPQDGGEEALITPLCPEDDVAVPCDGVERRYCNFEYSALACL